MLIYKLKNLSDKEKLDCVNDYLDFLQFWESKLWFYDLYREFEFNSRQKARFLRICVPCCFELLNHELILKNIQEEIQYKVECVAFEYPSFYVMSAIVGAIHCFWESLSVKKVISRWSQILLGIY